MDDRARRGADSNKHFAGRRHCRSRGPSPAVDYLDRPLDFNELLIENPDATFAVRSPATA